jgi:hypothetical protein
MVLEMPLLFAGGEDVSCEKMRRWCACVWHRSGRGGCDMSVYFRCTVSGLVVCGAEESWRGGVACERYCGVVLEPDATYLTSQY